MAVIPQKQAYALLLSPAHLLDSSSIIQILHISRSKQGINLYNHEINSSVLRDDLFDLPEAGTKALLKFQKSSFNLYIADIKKQFQKQQAGVSFETYYKNSISRFLHGLFESIRPFAPQVPWYHRVPTAKGHFKTGVCTFNSFKPRLKFEAIKKGEAIQLQALVVVNHFSYPLQQFRRYEFLLEKAEAYFLISYKDYQTLEWLENARIEQYGNDPRGFSTTILARLEADYEVNRNDLFPVAEINTLPINRVALSEISNSFLVLTPQWVYDGIVVEGPWKENYETTLQGETFRVQRNREQESAFVEQIASLHPNFSRQVNGYYYLSFADAQKKQWFLKVYHRLLDDNIQVAGMDMLQHFRYSPHQASVEAVIDSKHENSVLIHMKVSFGNEEVPLPELQKIVQSGQRSLLLKDGSLGILNEEWLQRFGTLLRHGKIVNRLLQVPRWFAFFEEDQQAVPGIMKPVLNKDWWKKWQDWQHETSTAYQPPESLHATLRPYQQRGIEWMMLLSEAGAGALLADDMGLGKTLQTICLLVHQLEHQPRLKQLIVCPSSLLYNWQQELAKFAPGITSLIYHGPARRHSDLLDGPGQVIITSYGTIRADIEQFATIRFGVVVLDESHNIKNPAALITRATGQLNAATRVALSGTPVMNNTFDLYAQLNFILPGMFGSLDFFKREYADRIDRDHDPDKILALKKLTAPFILRRTKEQVAVDLPEKTEMVMWCKMSAAQKTMYDEIKESIRDSLFLNIKNDGLNRSKLAILQGMLRLRQVCNSPMLLPEEQQTCTDSVKTELLMNELSNELKGHKVLVFSQFTGMLNLLAKACTERSLAYYHFDGQTPPAKRSEMVSSFQAEGNKTNIFLISLKAGNTGLNLTAADYVFLFDPWWNTAVQQQAIDRTHRIGQTKNVFAYKMICKDTIEEKIIQMQERKQKLAEDLVSADEGFVQSLTEEDIAFLFS